MYYITESNEEKPPPIVTTGENWDDEIEDIEIPGEDPYSKIYYVIEQWLGLIKTSSKYYIDVCEILKEKTGNTSGEITFMSCMISQYRHRHNQNYQWIFKNRKQDPFS